MNEEQSQLNKELIELMQTADLLTGVHTKVNNSNIYSGQHLRDIRYGRKSIPKSKDGIKKIKKIISLYQKEIEKITKQIPVNL